MSDVPSEIIVDKIPIITLVGYFMGYLLIHFIIGTILNAKKKEFKPSVVKELLPFVNTDSVNAYKKIAKGDIKNITFMY